MNFPKGSAGEKGFTSRKTWGYWKIRWAGRVVEMGSSEIKRRLRD